MSASERKYEVGPDFVRAVPCPRCQHTMCGDACDCNCDANRAEAELDAAWKAAGVPVRGMVSLAEVVADLRSNRDAAYEQVIRMKDLLDKFRDLLDAERGR